MNERRVLLKVLAAAIGIAALSAIMVAPARADDGLHVFWEVAGKHNTVYLLGSVHVLQANDHALPAVTDAAFADAEVLVEELDPFAAQGEIFGADVQALQMLPQGQTLAPLLGAELNARLGAAANSLGLDAHYLDSMQPWYVATLISAARQLKAGYTPEDGVDYQIAMRARREEKPIVGLETVAEQLGFFASMSMRDQCDFLADSLAESDSPEDLFELTQAWRRGDLVTLQAKLTEGMDELPELFKKIVADRNQNWLPRIEQMLADADRDYLVVTGALHMVGPQGLVEQLRARGYRITRK